MTPCGPRLLRWCPGRQGKMSVPAHTTLECTLQDNFLSFFRKGMKKLPPLQKCHQWIFHALITGRATTVRPADYGDRTLDDVEDFCLKSMAVESSYAVRLTRCSLITVRHYYDTSKAVGLCLYVRKFLSTIFNTWSRRYILQSQCNHDWSKL